MATYQQVRCALTNYRKNSRNPFKRWGWYKPKFVREVEQVFGENISKNGSIRFKECKQLEYVLAQHSRLNQRSGRYHLRNELNGIIKPRLKKYQSREQGLFSRLRQLSFKEFCERYRAVLSHDEIATCNDIVRSNSSETVASTVSSATSGSVDSCCGSVHDGQSRWNSWDEDFTSGSPTFFAKETEAVTHALQRLRRANPSVEEEVLVRQHADPDVAATAIQTFKSVVGQMKRRPPQKTLDPILESILSHNNPVSAAEAFAELHHAEKMEGNWQTVLLSDDPSMAAYGISAAETRSSAG